MTVRCDRACSVGMGGPCPRVPTGQAAMGPPRGIDDMAAGDGRTRMTAARPLGCNTPWCRLSIRPWRRLEEARTNHVAAHQPGRRALQRTMGICAAMGLTVGAAAPAVAATGRPDSTDQCTFPTKVIEGTPWSLQRVILDQLWRDTKGRGVRVAVIDTGVDRTNPQLASAVNPRLGRDFLDKGGDGTNDPAGHGTKVAGIIAARKAEGSGFVGLAPEATIMPIRQNDERNSGRVDALAQAIRHAVNKGAGVINVSQDTTSAPGPDSSLARAVDYALSKDVVLVAAAGNDGSDGASRNTYPAALPGVLAVGASDRNNERASFSQAGEFVGVAAPGVDMVSTVPRGGQCVDNGTSFAAPYVAGVAALIRAKHPRWHHDQVIAQIEQTAQRTALGHNRFVGWGVVDPVKALTEDATPIDEPTPDTGVHSAGQRVVPAQLTVAETPQERTERIATYVLGVGVVVVLLVIGASVALRDWRRRQRAIESPGRSN